VKSIAYVTAKAAPVVSTFITNVLTSPPLEDETISLAAFSGARFIYFRLHETPGIPWLWFGEAANGDTPTAFRVTQIEQMQIAGAVVVIGNCYGEGSQFVSEFYRAGASAVIAAPGENYGGSVSREGADVLAAWILAGLRFGLPPGFALAIARVRVALQIGRRGLDKNRVVKVAADTLQFKTQPKENFQ